MTQGQSLLLTSVNRSLDGVDAAALVSERGLTAAQIEGTDLGDVYSAHANDAEGKLFVGTGDYAFDAEVAAALGVPVVLIADDERAGELAKARVEKGGGAVSVVKQDALADLELPEATQVMSAEVFEAWLLNEAKAHQSHIVLPEGEDDRILQAADELLAKDIAKLTILGDEADIERRATDLGLDLSKATVINHLESELLEEFAADFAELRKSKGITLDEARETMKDISYFATMMVHKGLADGMVSGAAHTTAHTIKPSFQIIKTAPGSVSYTHLTLPTTPYV